MQGHRILNPTDPTPIFVNQHGPLMLLDNTFVVKPDGLTPVVRMEPPTGGAQCVSIGNRFFGADRVEVNGELTAQDNASLDYAAADLTVPAGADLQLVGDGQETTLIWEGADGGTMLKVAGPMRARSLARQPGQGRGCRRAGLHPQQPEFAGRR